MTIASNDAKVAFTGQASELEFMLQYGKTRSGSPSISPDAGYAQAGVALRDLAQYENWEAGGFLGYLMGGYDSKASLVKRFTIIRDKFKTKIPVPSHVIIATRAIEKTNLPQAMGAKTCEEDPAQAAVDKYGTFYGRIPGAQLLTCHRKKVIFIGGSLAILIVLAVLSPYANLLSKMLPDKKRKRRKKN